MDNLKQVWEQAINQMKDSDITEVSYETWIKDIKPLSKENDTIILSVENDIIKSMVNKNYKKLIANTIKNITNKEFEIKIIIPGEKNDEQKNEVKREEIKREAPKITRFTNRHGLNPKYTFDTFVIGHSNRFAHAASVAVAEAPARAYNPLFIYGGVGLGKTHLMHAIGQYIADMDPEKNIAYISSETFTNDLINSIKDDRNEEFRNKYRSIDILLIDDIQFIAGKERTQEEFFHTFNALYDSQKQIILSSDRPPKEIPTLEDRLRSRFEWGLITDIQPPDFETRIAILRKKAQLEKIEIPDEVMHFIASKIKSNIRELEGALIRIIAYGSLTNSDISIELAAEALKEVFSSKPNVIDVDYIKEIVCQNFNIKQDDMISKKRTRNIAYPRQIAMYLARELTDMSLPKIGKEFGGRDHTTVIHAYDKVTKDLLKDKEIKEKINKIITELKGE